MAESEDWQPIKHAADAVGIHRITLGRWVQAKKLRTRTGRVRNLQTILVNVPEVRRLVGDGVGPGRPPKSDAAVDRSDRKTPRRDRKTPHTGASRRNRQPTEKA